MAHLDTFIGKGACWKHPGIMDKSIRGHLAPTDVMVRMDGSMPGRVETSHCEGRPIWFLDSVVVTGFFELEHDTAELRYPAKCQHGQFQII